MIMISGTLQAMLYDWMIVITCDITSDPKWSFGRTTRDAQQHQHDARLGGAKRGNGRNWWRFGMFRWDMMIFSEKKHRNEWNFTTLHGLTSWDLWRFHTLCHMFRKFCYNFPIRSRFCFRFVSLCCHGIQRVRIAQATQVSRETARSVAFLANCNGLQRSNGSLIQGSPGSPGSPASRFQISDHHIQ